MKKFQCLLFFSLFVLGLSLICYDCEPTSEGKCVNPGSHNIKMTHCEDSGSKKLDLRSLLANTSYECFSIRYKSRGNSQFNGVYRGCIEKPSGQSSCAHLKKTLTDGDVELCGSCSGDRCNTHSFL